MSAFTGTMYGPSAIARHKVKWRTRIYSYCCDPVASDDIVVAGITGEDGTEVWVSNEHGDCSLGVRRPDGTRGSSYSGPAYIGYTPMYRWEQESPDPFRFIPLHHKDGSTDITEVECAVGTRLAQALGWF